MLDRTRPRFPLLHRLSRSRCALIAIRVTVLMVFALTALAPGGTVLGAQPPPAAPGSSTAQATNEPPRPPVLVSPSDGGYFSASSVDLRAQVSDPEGDPLTVKFYVRPLNFTLVHIPDTQRILANNGLKGIVNWIAGHRTDKNIGYTVQVGDITEGDGDTEWQQASDAFAVLENAKTVDLPDGIPYGVLAGNHDSKLDAYFGVSRFDGRSYYAGHYAATTNQNNYSLFRAGGMDFIAINMSDCPAADEINWADALLKTYSSRRAIVSTHTLFPWVAAPSWHPCGTALFDGLSDNANLFALLSGHCRMEANREDIGAAGQTVYSIAADFTNQLSDNIRLMSFSPHENLIRVRTYSPSANAFETDANSQFDLPYDMSGAGFDLLGTWTNVASGSTVARTLYDLVDGAQYEWYVTVSDGHSTVTGPTWRFINSATPPSCHALTLGHTGNGGDPVASPANSNGCAAGQYLPGATITLTGGSPAAGWKIGGWTGTVADASTAASNSVSMPAAAHTARVNYAEREYSVQVTVLGGGSVQNTPGNPYSYEEVATLQPAAGAGQTFTGWSGPNAGELSDQGDGTWRLVMNDDKAVTAQFADLTPPETTIDSGPADPSNTDAATFVFSSNESPVSYACALDGAAFAVCESPATYTALADGIRTFRVRATDAAGNTDPTPATRSWTVKTPFTLDALALRQSPDKLGWSAVDGNLDDGYTVSLDPAAEWRYLDVASLAASHDLANGYHPFFVDQDELPAGWLDYWASRGVTAAAGEPWQQQMWQIVNGNAPVFLLRVNNGALQLVDGLGYAMGGADDFLRVDGGYLLGAYKYAGELTDVYGQKLVVEARVAFIGPDAPAAPAVAASRRGNALHLSWPAVGKDAGGRFTQVVAYEIYCAAQPYFAPVTGNRVVRTEALEYDVAGAGAAEGGTYCVARAFNIVGPSANSNWPAAFGYKLAAGSPQ